MDDSNSYFQSNANSFHENQLRELDEINELDLSNPEILEMVAKSGLKNISYEELIKQKNDRIKEYYEEDQKLQDIMLRHWLSTRGKKHMIDFDDKERSKLKQYFKSLDEDQSGSIGIEELEDPLISLGIADSRDDVKRIIDSVDDDGSGQIEFGEFLDIIKNKNGEGSDNVKDNLIIDFFKNMIKGKLGSDQGQVPIPKSLPFSLIISTIRRQKLMNALMSTGKKKEEGEKVMKAYGKLVSIRNAQGKKDDKSQKSNFSSARSSANRQKPKFK